MRSHLFYIVGVAAVIATLGFGVTGSYNYVAQTLGDSTDNMSAVYRAFFQPSTIQVDGLKDKFDKVTVGASATRRTAKLSQGGVTAKTDKKIRILLMPGHEPGFGGAEYRDLKEREMTVALVKEMKILFEQEGHFEVIVPRDNDAWSPEFLQYFNDQWDLIKDFQTEQKAEMIRLISDGKLSRLDNGIYHNKAPDDVAIRLFGINKWVNDNKVDIAIHVHFNDYPHENQNSPGDYEGFAIYVPEGQYSNSVTSKTIAENIHKRLAKYSVESNLPSESGGVVEEQELIAIGKYNTVDAPSMLIEYGYIYEPQFKTAAVRRAAFKDLAYGTYKGVMDFFQNSSDSQNGRSARNSDPLADDPTFPYRWKKTLSKDLAAADPSLALDAYTLQKALTIDGLYPPDGKSRYDCPISGLFGPCTEKAISDFQMDNKIKGEAGKVGAKTLKALNAKFGVDVI